MESDPAQPNRGAWITIYPVFNFDKDQRGAGFLNFRCLCF